MNAAYEARQATLLQQLEILPDGAPFNLEATDLVFTLDVQYAGDWGYVALDVLEWGSRSHHMLVVKAPVTADYEPGYFAFREGPILQAAVGKAVAELGTQPALLIIDGHGTAHPRKMGLACWVGIQMGIPAIGLAKRTLLKVEFDLGEAAGSEFYIREENEVVGTVLRTQTGIKPVFVSAGHQISQARSVEIIRELVGSYRLIEPIRRADQAARNYAKGTVAAETVVLSS